MQGEIVHLRLMNTKEQASSLNLGMTTMRVGHRDIFRHAAETCSEYSQEGSTQRGSNIAATHRGAVLEKIIGSRVRPSGEAANCSPLTYQKRNY